MRLRHDRFELDVDALLLRVDGEIVSIQPKVFNLLRILIERQGGVVTKKELFSALWPGEFVSDSALTWCVSQARKALRQGRPEKTPIETVHRRGYRFSAPVVPVAPPQAASWPAPEAWQGPVGAQPVTAEPFVGREVVLQRLDQLLKAAQAGDGRICLLTGEAGIGKTRTAQELASQARRHGFDVWQGRGFPTGGAPALWPWVQVLRDAKTKRELEPEASELLALILPDAAHDEEHGSSAAGTEESLFWILDRVSRFLVRAPDAPRAIIFDDLQEADDASLQLLLLIGQALSSTPLLIVATLRVPAQLSERHQQRCNAVARFAERIHLGRLDAAAIETYARSALAGQLPEGLAEVLLDKTGGVPLFVHEALEALAGHNSASGGTLDDVRFAKSAHDVMRDTLGALSAAARQVLDAASVVGDEVSISILQHTCELGAGELVVALDDAAAARVLRPRDESGRVAFRHSMLRELIYEELPGAWRTELHLRVARAMEPALPMGRIGEIAYHYHCALPLAPASTLLKHARSAADAASTLGAFEQAARLQGWALDAYRYRAVEEPREFAELLARQAELQRASGQRTVSRDTWRSLIGLAKRHGFPDLLVRAARNLRGSTSQALLADPMALDALETARTLLGPSDLALGSEVVGYLSHIPPYSLEMAESRRLSADAVGLAKRSKQRSIVLRALRSRLYSLSGPADFDAQLKVADEMLGMIDMQHGASFVYREVQLSRFLTLLQKGEMDRADEALAQTARAAHHSKVPEAIWHADRLLATRALSRGEYDQAERTFQELEERRRQLDFGYESMFLGPQVFVLMRERGDLKFLNPPVGRDWPKRAAHDAAGVPRMYEIAFVAPLVKSGREVEARAIFESAGQAGFKNIPENSSYLWLMVECAEAAIALRDKARAKLVFSQLEPYGDCNAVHVHGFSMGAVWHYLGRLARLLERREDAQRLFARAVEQNVRTGQPAFAARSRYLLARLLKRRGREEREQAAHLLANVIHAARSLGMSPLLTSAEQLWSQLGLGGVPSGLE